jgi:hypothetical protein
LVVNPPRPIIDTFFPYPTFLLLPFLSKSPPRANGGISFVALCRCFLVVPVAVVAFAFFIVSEGEGSAFAVAVGVLILMENDVTNAEFDHFIR